MYESSPLKVRFQFLFSNNQQSPTQLEVSNNFCCTSHSKPRFFFPIPDLVFPRAFRFRIFVFKLAKNLVDGGP